MKEASDKEVVVVAPGDENFRGRGESHAADLGETVRGPLLRTCFSDFRRVL